MDSDERVYGVALIGLGIMGTRMLRGLHRHPRFAVRALCDADRRRALECAKECAEAAACDVAATALDQVGVDLAYIATPPAHHAAPAHAALDRGLPIFLEKPLAVDLEEGEELTRRASEAGLATAVNFPFATLPGIDRVTRQLAAGKAGTVHRVEISFHFNRWPRAWQSAGEWIDRRREGGFLREVFSHFAFLTHRLLGAPLVPTTQQVDYPKDSERAEVHACARFDCGGVPVFLSGGHRGAAPDHCSWTLFGSDHSYRLENWSVLLGGTRSEWRLLVADDASARPAGLRQLDALAQLLDGERSPLPDLGEAFAVQRVVEALAGH